MSNLLTGKHGEDIAALYLKKNGYSIIERNFKKRYSEVDIVAIEKNVLVFVEVKTRLSTDFGTPFEAITKRKRDQLTKAAHFYKMTHKNMPDLLRIDAVSVEFDVKSGEPIVQLIKNITG